MFLYIFSAVFWYFALTVLSNVLRSAMMFNYFDTRNYPRDYRRVTDEMHGQAYAYLQAVQKMLKKLKLIALLVGYVVICLIYMYLN